jgi:hypothetical protein
MNRWKDEVLNVYDCKFFGSSYISYREQHLIFEILGEMPNSLFVTMYLPPYEQRIEQLKDILIRKQLYDIVEEHGY